MDYRSTYKNKTILVTGGAGAIGSNLTAALVEAGAKEVLILDDLSSTAEWNIPEHSAINFITGSVLDEEKVKQAFRRKPDIVYHLAALFANQNSIDNPEKDLMVNGLGTLKIVQYCHLTGIERLVYASSGCSVYGKSPLPLKEEYVSLDLDTPYQITKMLGELYCNFSTNFYGLPTVRTRLFNSFGPGEIPGRYRNVIPNFIYLALNGEPLPIMGTGESTRDWTFVEDIVDGFLRAGSISKAIGQAINFGSGMETRVIDMANMVNELTGNRAGIRYIEMRKWDTKNRLLASIDKARNLLGFNPTSDFKESLASTVKWFRTNWDKIKESSRF